MMTIVDIIQAIPGIVWAALFLVAFGVYERLIRDDHADDEELAELDRNIVAVLAELRETNKLLTSVLFEQLADAEDAQAQTQPAPRFRGGKREGA